MRTKHLLLLSFLLLVNKSFSQVNQNSHYIGEIFGGGIVFYVEENGKHGLIASASDVIKKNLLGFQASSIKVVPLKASLQ